MKIHIDFETRSTVDLRKTGVHVYAADPSTDVVCMAYCVDDGPVQLWIPSDKWPGFDMSATFYAHNAAFELAIWNDVMVKRYGWPALFAEQTRCTMAMCYAMALPGSLDQAAKAAKLPFEKDMKGNRVMLQLSKPRAFGDNGDPIWWQDDPVHGPAKLGITYDYCKQDVEVERALEHRLRELIPQEQSVWQLDQKINNVGVPIDINAAKNAVAVAAVARKQLDAEMKQVTGGWVSNVTKVADLVEWLGLQGVDTVSIGKADILELLNRDDLPPHCRKALEIRQEGAKTSTKKLEAMLDAASADGRVRGAFQYHAATTGRWGGRRVQFQNVPRPSLKQKEIDQVMALIGRVVP